MTYNLLFHLPMNSVITGPRILRPRLIIMCNNFLKYERTGKNRALLLLISPSAINLTKSTPVQHLLTDLSKGEHQFSSLLWIAVYINFMS